MYSVASILGGLTVPIVTGAGETVDFIITNVRTSTGPKVLVDLNITASTGAAIVAWTIDVAVNPDVLEPGYDETWIMMGEYYGEPYFLYKWAVDNPNNDTTIDVGTRNVADGTIKNALEAVDGWGSLSSGTGADSSNTPRQLLATLRFTPKNTSVAYSPIVLTRARYTTTNDGLQHDANVTNGHYGTPIHEVGLNSVAGPSTVERGVAATFDVEAFNVGGFTETKFNASLYYAPSTGPNQGDWQFIGNITYTLDPLETAVKSTSWDTEFIAPRGYDIMANTTVAGDVDTGNNEVQTTITITNPLYDLAVNAPMLVNFTSPFIGDIVEIQVTAEVLFAEEDINYSVLIYFDGGVVAFDNVTLQGKGDTTPFTINWDTTGTTGNTTAAIEAWGVIDAVTGWVDNIQSNNNQTVSPVQVRVPGDVYINGIVDIYDIATISAHWTGPPAGPQPYDTLVDIDHDGDIDIDDMEILSGHMGETP